MATPDAALLQQIDKLSAPELRRLLAEHLTSRKLGLTWERDAIAHDRALNADVVLPRLVREWSHTPEGCTAHRNLIIEGDNFDSLRLLRSTHAGKVRVIYIDPPYNTGNKDWVYNDSYVGANDRWRHSQWLEFLYQRLSLARELLTADGVILVSINDENRSRLELLMDDVFPGRRLGSFVWKTRSGSNDESGGRLSIEIMNTCWFMGVLALVSMVKLRTLVSTKTRTTIPEVDGRRATLLSLRLIWNAVTVSTRFRIL